MGTATAQPAVKKALSLSPRATTALARSSSRLPEGRLKRAVAALVVKKS